MTYPYRKICFTLISDLPSRAKDILTRRFGLNDQEPQTLEAVGQIHGITRERVRQIVEAGLAQIREEISYQARAQEALRYFSDSLKKLGHLKREDLFIKTIDAEPMPNHIIFLLHMGEQFHGQRETEYFHPFWSNKKEFFESASDLAREMLKYFEGKEKAIPFDQLKEDLLGKFQETTQVKVPSHTLLSFLEVSKRIGQGYDGYWGLKRWAEVRPRGIKDKAYLVFKQTKRPLHFSQVAELIKELQEALVDQKQKEVLSQTVHNELIKDPRFVLVGRGTYALSEWGYKPGTVKEVMVQILKENGVSMEKEVLVKKTLEQRQVKENTVVLNLQDRNCFFKDAEGRYSLMETTPS
ncbi:MAG: sigma factor-like helix-turn-helix DNA-binding protein [Patescibacteria group bacterium]